MTEIQQRTAEQLFRTLGELKGGAMKFGQALSVLEAALPGGDGGPVPRAPHRSCRTPRRRCRPRPCATPRPRTSAPTGGTSWSGSTADRPRPRRSARCTRAAGTTGARSRSRCSTPAPATRCAPTCASSPGWPGRSARWCPGIDVKPLIAELQARAVEELDYQLEAEAQTAFAEAFRDDPDIVVPDVVAVGDTVLVTEWLESPASLASVIAEGTPGGARPLRRAVRAVPVRRAGAHRDAARRPAPRQLPDPARPRTAGPAGSACSTSAPWPGCPSAGSRRAMGSLIRIAADRGRRGAGRGAARRGLHQGPGSRSTRSSCSTTSSPFVEPTQVERVPVLARVDARRSSSGSTTRGSRRTRVATQAEPAAVVPADPPHLARRDRRAQPARGRGAVPGDPRRVAARVRRG